MYPSASTPSAHVDAAYSSDSAELRLGWKSVIAGCAVAGGIDDCTPAEQPAPSSCTELVFDENAIGAIPHIAT